MQIENDIENYLIRKTEMLGGLCLKFVSPGRRGVPDRIILIDGKTFFVELKRPGGFLRKDQLKMKEKFEKQGINVYVVDTKQKADVLLNITQQ
ncbi:VRR-NUC domain protein [Tetragenococcus muriaticus PMC-11-5]|uniref:VRR-NUC domain protein n=1 Tax=Tetragenococcus muriaticus PMC-11-5 TaxID=1302649 RepID=A0A091CAJ0_9ENTE|nr:VRR-NUC domain-containing protein [Tetragenococcus muriaticus]KFN93637.1 VRR-NUC domain protein [Tetragenococcus muriaticus PMC-11-5]